MSTALVEATQATTILDAINVMLKGIGEAPAVSLLEGGGSVDVESAHGTLMETSREVQSHGWHFNTDTALLLSREESTNFIRLPQNTLRLDEVRDSATALARGLDVVQRGLRLYDRTEHSYVFDRDVYVDIVTLLPFEDLPQYARTYITVKAARKFAQDETASDSVSRFTLRDEEEALAEMQRLDNRHEDPSMKLHSPFVQKMLRR